MSEKFDLAAKEWDKGDMRQGTAQSVFQAIVGRIALQKSMNILDFGCGTGLLSFKVAPLVKSVTGVDVSTKMLEELEAKNSSAIYVKALNHDMLAHPIKETFDGVVSSMAMHHIEDTAKLLGAFYAHLSRGGFVALADLEAEEGTFHSDNEGVHHFGFDKEKLRATMAAIGFVNIRFHEACTIEKGEGKYPIFLVTATK